MSYRFFIILCRLSLQEFQYAGRRQIVEEIANASNRDSTQPVCTTTTKKSMTLPARMQPPSEFNEETTANLDHQAQVSVTPITINSNGTGSIGRVENSKKGFICLYVPIY